MFATVECASQVNLQDLLPKFSSSLLERSSREPAGIIHQAVQFSIVLHGLFYQRCTLLFLPHVSRAEEGFAALFANDSGRLLAALLLNIPENDGGAFCGNEAGAPESDAPCRSCDNDNFLLKSIAHFYGSPTGGRSCGTRALTGFDGIGEGGGQKRGGGLLRASSTLERAKISRYPESRRVTPHTAPKYFLPGWHAQGTSGLRLALRQTSQWRGPR